MADEQTPLLASGGDQQEQPPRPKSNRVVWRILLCSFLISLSFSFTQVPILFVFRLMTCEEYYKVHPSPPEGSGDKCTINAIEASTARSLALLGASTTIFGEQQHKSQNFVDDSKSWLILEPFRCRKFARYNCSY